MEKGYDKVDGASHDADMQRVFVYIEFQIWNKYQEPPQWYIQAALEGFTGPKRIRIFHVFCLKIHR